MEVVKGSSKRSVKVVMFPWLAHGHISVYVHLTNKLAHRGIALYFVSTPLNMAKMRPRLDKRVKIVELPMPHVQGLPSECESTSNLPPQMMPLLKKALDNLEEPFQTLLQGLRPDCVIHDCLQHWMPRAASALGIAAINFVTFNSAGFCYFLDMVMGGKDPEDLTVDDWTHAMPDYPSKIRLRPHEARAVANLKEVKSNGITDSKRCLVCFRDSQAVIINSFVEVETKFILHVQKLLGKPVFPVGPLIDDDDDDAGREDSTSCDSCAMEWLDRQAPMSVVYVALGSECFVSKEQIHELALGLEASQQPFLWFLRLPWEKGEEDVWAFLPDGFAERTTGRGVVTCGWAPQMRILRHGSTGGFLSHCGWSSLVEAMSVGVPVMAMPVQLDQPWNARLLSEELNVGVEIVQRADDGLFAREEIEKVVRLVMVEEEGMEIKRNAKELCHNIWSKTIMGNGVGSQSECLDQLVDHIKQLSCNNNSDGLI